MSALSRFHRLIVLALLAATGAIVSPSAQSQTPRPADPLPAAQPSLPPDTAAEVDAVDADPDVADQEPASVVTDEQLLQIEEWIEQLSSAEFATRERASGHLMEIGKAVLPMLRRAASETTDPETRLRAEQIIKQLTSGDMQARISEFLTGQETEFDGWTVVRDSLGDSIPIRELFVEMMIAHPDLVKSLELETRDRSLALDNLLTRVQSKLRGFGSDPEAADVFALLLISNDANVTLDTLYDTVLLNLMRRQVASVIRRDAQLSGPFHALLNKWIVRCGTVIREDAILLGMEWDLPATLPVALRTLNEVNSTETIAICFQAISKFGDRQQTETLTRYLDDPRPVASRGFANDQSIPQVRDLAMLSLAMIYGLPFDEIGMSHVQTHPASGFILSDLSYPSDPERSRARARKRIDQLLQEQAGGQ